MKTQTDNSNIVMDENDLKFMAGIYSNQYIADNISDNVTSAKCGFIAGANFKETQLQPLIDNHAELLEVVQMFCDTRTAQSNDNFMQAYHKGKDAIQKANKLIQ